MTARGWLAAATGAMAGLLLTAPASASVRIDLKPEHRGQDAAGFGAKRCAGPLSGRQAQDAWHFTLPTFAADDFVSLTLTFKTPGGDVKVGPITSEDPSMPTMGTNWSGILDNVGRSADDKHAYVYTAPGWTLLDGEAEVEPNTATGTFGLTYTCPATAGLNPNAAPVPGGSAQPGRVQPSGQAVREYAPPGAGGVTGGTGSWQGSITLPGGEPAPSGGVRTGGGGTERARGWFGTTAAFFVSIVLAGFLIQRRLRRN